MDLLLVQSCITVTPKPTASRLGLFYRRLGTGRGIGLQAQPSNETKTSGKIVPPRLAEEMTTMTPQSDSIFGLGLVSYDGSCGTFHGHEGNISGTVSIALADGDGGLGVMIAFDLATYTDPGMPALADDLLCRYRSEPNRRRGRRWRDG